VNQETARKMRAALGAMRDILEEAARPEASGYGTSPVSAAGPLAALLAARGTVIEADPWWRD
jgi:hypothetical protein